MKIHITAGDCLNEILQQKYPAERFIPFREAMIKGAYSAPLFSADFCKERAHALGVSQAEYTQKLSDFLTLLRTANTYQEIFLWFGDEPFCAANTKTVIKALQECGYQGKLLLHIVIEETGEIVKTTVIQN